MRDARVSWSWPFLTGVRSQLVPKLQSKSIGVQGSGGFSTKKLKQPAKPDTLYHHLLIIDLEATCEEGWRFNFPHEIIDFPALLLDTRRRKCEAVFHTFFRPVKMPTLSTLMLMHRWNFLRVVG